VEKANKDLSLRLGDCCWYQRPDTRMKRHNQTWMDYQDQDGSGIAANSDGRACTRDESFTADQGILNYRTICQDEWSGINKLECLAPD